MGIGDLFLYLTLFTSLFFEVFLLINYFEIREEVKKDKLPSLTCLSYFPSVSIIVPCFNEEKTISKTINSLLALNYPKDKLSLFIIDDGSTDSTQQVLNAYRNNPQIEIYYKENGGKHSALNFALEKITSDLVGCLDADSFVDKEALQKIVPKFLDESIMAVTPSIHVDKPKTILQRVQRIEYSWGILFRRILASINGLYVTPGPFSIFRTRMFKEIGGYREAHHTEDMELALRMHKFGLKIANAQEANVYTVAPAQLKGLYKQRVRWTYGFLNNARDYKELYFNKKYGTLGMFVLPLATFSIFTTIFAAGNFVRSAVVKGLEAFGKYQAVGFSWGIPKLSFHFYTLNTSVTWFLTLATVLFTFVILYLSLYMANGKARFSRDILYYLALYVFIVPLWVIKATFNTVFAKKTTWR
jgi:cellulose synthase/poly-beta-1,6-N-acetylglucosamine synthase-like glycosyltransferase